MDGPNANVRPMTCCLARRLFLSRRRNQGAAARFVAGHSRPVGSRDRISVHRRSHAPARAGVRRGAGRTVGHLPARLSAFAGIADRQCAGCLAPVAGPAAVRVFCVGRLSQLLQAVERIRLAYNPQLSILGVALTMFDRRNNLSSQVADDVRACLGTSVFDTVVPRNVRLSEAPSHGLPALIYDLRCPGSEAYIRLAREIMARLPQPAAEAA